MEKYKAIERSKDTGSTYSLLKKGIVPGIIYGKGTEPTKIAFENKVLLKLMHTGSFYSKRAETDESLLILFMASPIKGAMLICLIFFIFFTLFEA